MEMGTKRQLDTMAVNIREKGYFHSLRFLKKITEYERTLEIEICAPFNS